MCVNDSDYVRPVGVDLSTCRPPSNIGKRGSDAPPTKGRGKNLYIAALLRWNSSYLSQPVRVLVCFLRILISIEGAVVASPTFSLPEYIGGTRNWCAISDTHHVVVSWLLCFIGTIGTSLAAIHSSTLDSGAFVQLTRASWIRDSSFTLYALLRLGFTHEANCKLQ